MLYNQKKKYKHIFVDTNITLQAQFNIYILFFIKLQASNIKLIDLKQD